jgi:WD40 repeat protein
MAFSPDSEVLAAQTDGGPDQPISRLFRLDARSGEPLAHVAEIPGRAAMFLGFTGAGHDRVVTSSVADGATVVRHAATLAPVRRLAVSAPVAALSSRGVVAFGARDGAVRFVDLRSGRLRMAHGHDGAVTEMRFNDDGSRLISSGIPRRATRSSRSRIPGRARCSTSRSTRGARRRTPREAPGW